MQALQVFHVFQRAKPIVQELSRNNRRGVLQKQQWSAPHLLLRIILNKKTSASFSLSGTFCNSEALCATVSYQGNPQDDVLVNKTVEVLVEEEETRSDEGRVGKVQLTLCHVGHLKIQQAQLWLIKNMHLFNILSLKWQFKGLPALAHLQKFFRCKKNTKNLCQRFEHIILILSILSWQFCLLCYAL